MIDLAQSGTEGMRMSSKLIAEQAMARGWKVEAYYPASSQLRLTRADGKQIDIFSATPPSTSYAAATRADDKYVTYLSLVAHDLPMPATYLVGNDLAAAEHAASEVIQAGKACVIKPLDSGHGNGVTVDIKSVETVQGALEHALAYSDYALVQECVSGATDIRLTCIDGRVAGAVIRVPARVQGDGQHTIDELLDGANASEERGEKYEKRLNVIPKELVERYLGKPAMERVPENGEWVRLLGTANVGTGGETIEISDDLPEWLKDMATNAARVADLPVCGVDFLVAAEPKLESTEADLQPVIIELNKCPSLFLSEMPIYGTPKPTVQVYLDYLAAL